MPPAQLHSALPYLIGIPIVLLVMALRLRGMSQGRRLRLEWLWVTPALLIVVTVLALAPNPPAGLDWAYLAAAFVFGAVLGWYRGKMMHITVDPETHALNSKASPAALYFIVLIVAARVGLRYLAVGQAGAWHLSVGLLTGLFLAFAVGLLGVQRVEMWLRANRLLAEARAPRPSPDRKTA